MPVMELVKLYYPTFFIHKYIYNIICIYYRHYKLSKNNNFILQTRNVPTNLELY